MPQLRYAKEGFYFLHHTLAINSTQQKKMAPKSMIAIGATQTPYTRKNRSDILIFSAKHKDPFVLNMESIIYGNILIV